MGQSFALFANQSRRSGEAGRSLRAQIGRRRKQISWLSRSTPDAKDITGLPAHWTEARGAETRGKRRAISLFAPTAEPATVTKPAPARDEAPAKRTERRRSLLARRVPRSAVWAVSGLMLGAATASVALTTRVRWSEANQAWLVTIGSPTASARAAAVPTPVPAPSPWTWDAVVSSCVRGATRSSLSAAIPAAELALTGSISTVSAVVVGTTAVIGCGVGVISNSVAEATRTAVATGS